MKTQKFSEKQIKALVNGKSAVTSDEIKKDEIPTYFTTECKKIHTITKRNDYEKTECEIGDVVPAANDKGEELWRCSVCNLQIYKPIIGREIWSNKLFYELFYIRKEDERKPCPNECAKTLKESKEYGLKPFKVRLEKIKKRNKFTCLLYCLLHLEDGTRSNTGLWLKTWKAVKE